MEQRPASLGWASERGASGVDDTWSLGPRGACVVSVDVRHACLTDSTFRPPSQFLARVMHDYTECDATELAARVATKQVSALELVEVAIAAIERVNPQLNAVVHRMYDEARQLANGPLQAGPFRGVPMVVKDFDGYVRGAPFTASSRL